ncbi:hypothetical protein [Brevundimonas sp. FT23028]|uniref:hypothetical protein n=1 Tax=Brevundimonas sp. FT23028 TaxID=3393748 RepID=UPI003B5891B8
MATDIEARAARSTVASLDARIAAGDGSETREIIVMLCRFAVLPTVLAAALAMAGAASAQAVLTAPTDPAWVGIGTGGGATYSILPSSLTRDGPTVRFLLKAEVPPAPDGDTPNVIVAETVVDCAASTIGTGDVELYSLNRGFAQARHREATLETASDPGQILVIGHVCAD